MVIVMQELNRVDRAIERPIYSNANVAELHQKGLLSRPEAEALDILYTGFAESQPHTIDTEEMERGEEESVEHSFVAIVHEGAVIPILNLDEIMQLRRTTAENLLICSQVARAFFDVLLEFLEEEK